LRAPVSLVKDKQNWFSLGQLPQINLPSKLVDAGKIRSFCAKKDPFGLPLSLYPNCKGAKHHK
jgi:hypothetical protein